MSSKLEPQTFRITKKTEKENEFFLHDDPYSKGQPHVSDDGLIECRLKKMEGESGFLLRNENGHFLERIEKNGPADVAGVNPGDQIIKVNGVDVTKESHDDVVRKIVLSGKNMTFSERRTPKQQTTRTQVKPKAHTSTPVRKQKVKKNNRKTRKGANLYDDDKTCLITETSSESLSDENEEYTYRGKNVRVAYIPDKYKPLREVEMEDFTEVDNYYNCDRLFEGDEVPSNDKDAILGKENHHKTLKKILSKKWHNKKAKRVRKVIRSGTRNSIKYLQAGTTNMNSLFPDATTLVGTFSRQNQPM